MQSTPLPIINQRFIPEVKIKAPEQIISPIAKNIHKAMSEPRLVTRLF